MNERREIEPVPGPASTRRNDTLQRLSASPRIEALEPHVRATIMAFRMIAVCGRVGHDPIEELTRRTGSIAAARAITELAQLVGEYWPDQVSVMRPCCAILSPDEWTLAEMTRHARAYDIAGFRAILAGFVRAERHDALYARSVALAYPSD